MFFLLPSLYAAKLFALIFWLSVPPIILWLGIKKRDCVQIILDFVVTTIAWKSICNPPGKNAYFAGRKVHLSPIFMLQPKSNQFNLCRSKYITFFCYPTLDLWEICRQPKSLSLNIEPDVKWYSTQNVKTKFLNFVLLQTYLLKKARVLYVRSGVYKLG